MIVFFLIGYLIFVAFITTFWLVNFLAFFRCLVTLTNSLRMKFKSFLKSNFSTNLKKSLNFFDIFLT